MCAVTDSVKNIVRTVFDGGTSRGYRLVSEASYDVVVGMTAAGHWVQLNCFSGVNKCWGYVKSVVVLEDMCRLFPAVKWYLV